MTQDNQLKIFRFNYYSYSYVKYCEVCLVTWSHRRPSNTRFALSFNTGSSQLEVAAD